MAVRSNSGSYPGTFTPAGGSDVASNTNESCPVVKANNLTGQSTTITVQFKSGANTVYIPRFYVNIQKRVDTFGGINTSRTYNIYNNRGVWAVANGANVVNSTTELSLAFMAADKKQQFAFIPYNDKYYLYNVNAGKFAYVDGTKLSLTECFTSEVENSPVTFATSTSPAYAATAPVVVQVGGESFGVSTAKSPDVFKYSPYLDDPGNASAIYEVGDFDNTKALAQIANTTSITYHLLYNGSERDNATIPTLVGAELSIPSTLDTYCMSYKYYSDAECTSEINNVPAGGGNVYAVATWNGPVRFTTTTSAPEYYNLNIRSQYLVYNDESTGDVTLQNTSEPFNDAASWAFIGDPYTGFKIINKTNGIDKYLTYTSVVSGGNSGNNNIQFIEDASFTNQYWYIDTNTGGFCLRMKENPSIYFHHDNTSKFLRTCSVSEWSAVHNDAGSTIIASTDEDVLFTLYETMKNWSFGTSIGQMNTTDETVITNATASSTLTAIGNVISTAQTSAYPDAYAALSQIQSNMSLVEPTAGFYRLRNVATGKYLTATALATDYSDTNKYVFANGNSTDASTVIRLYDKDSDGHLYMYNQGAGFGWVATTTGGKVGWITTAPDKYVNWFAGNAADQIAFALCLGNGTGDYAAYLKQGIYTTNASEEVIAGTDETADEAQWVVEEATSATVNLNSDGAATPTYYATFCAPFSYTVSGATAYTLAENGEYLVPTPFDGEVAAGTPVLLKGAAPTATLTIGTGYAATPTTSTALTGTYLAKTINGAADYVLGINAGVVGFYHWDSNNLSANRAYLASTSSVKGFAINWDGETDGISAVDNGQSAKDEAVYTLSGQRVSKPTRGLYIVNGKKVVIK